MIPLTSLGVTFMGSGNPEICLQPSSKSSTSNKWSKIKIFVFQRWCQGFKMGVKAKQTYLLMIRRDLMLWLLTGPLGYTWWIPFAPVFTFIYCWVISCSSTGSSIAPSSKKKRSLMTIQNCVKRSLFTTQMKVLELKQQGQGHSCYDVISYF